MTLNINGQSLPIDLSTLTPTNDIQINNATWVASTNILTITETN